MQHVGQIVMTRMQVHGKRLGLFSFHVKTAEFGELQEKVEALLKKNPSPSSEERQVHQVMSCGRKRWEHGRTSPPPGDHADLGGVEKAEGCQWRYGGLFGSVQAYPNLRISKTRKTQEIHLDQETLVRFLLHVFGFLTKGGFWTGTLCVRHFESD